MVARAFIGSCWCIIGDSYLARLYLSVFEGVLSGCLAIAIFLLG